MPPKAPWDTDLSARWGCRHPVGAQHTLGDMENFPSPMSCLICRGQHPQTRLQLTGRGDTTSQGSQHEEYTGQSQAANWGSS